MAKSKKNDIYLALMRRSNERLSSDALWTTINDFDSSKLGRESHDRSCALVLGSVLEQGLELAILSHCITVEGADDPRPIFKENDNAIDFSTKINLAYALGIYGKETRHDLGMMRHIRNAFAHSQAMISFKDKEISDAIDSLLFWKRAATAPYFVGTSADPKSVFINFVRLHFSYLAMSQETKAMVFADHKYGGIFL